VRWLKAGRLANQIRKRIQSHNGLVLIRRKPRQRGVPTPRLRFRCDPLVVVPGNRDAQDDIIAVPVYVRVQIELVIFSHILTLVSVEAEIEPESDLSWL